MALDNFQKQQRITILALFTSMSTLLCCALPIVLVSLGLGTLMQHSLTAIHGW